jgi:phosphate transport system substrate-binding protein
MVCEDYADDADTELAKAYVGYTVSAEGRKVAQDKAGAAALSAKMQASVKAAIDSIK